MSERQSNRVKPAAFSARRGPEAPDPAAGDTSWRESLPAISAEHRGSFQDAEADAAYRFAAVAAADRDVLDVGCGAGHGAEILRAAGARSVVGTDADERAVEIATRLYGEGVKFTRAEALALPFAANGFDMVICLEAFESAPDPEPILDGLRRVLAPGGLLIASLPLEPPRDPADNSPLGKQREQPDWERIVGERFDHVRFDRRRVCLGSAVVPGAANGAAPEDLSTVSWLGSEPSEDRSLIVVAGDEELPELPAAATLVGGRDLRAYRETVEAWQYRARRAEADGAAKHWELVASREAQRRLRKRLWHLEHKPLRKLFRVLRGRPANLGEGPPIRPPEREQDAWN